MENCNKGIQAESGYVLDPLALFYEISEDKSNTILLESLEVHTKAGNNSMLGISSALRISCLGQVVTVKILNENGKFAASKLKNVLPKEVTIADNENGFTITYPEVDANLDEDSRLKAITVIDALRKTLTIEPTSGSKKDLMLSGVFGYDLISSVEKLPEVPVGSNSCPDYCFYLLDLLVNIDHKSKKSTITAITFDESQVKAYSERVANLQAKLSNYKEVKRPDEISLSNEKVTTDISDADFRKIVENLKNNIKKGDIFQVVPSRTFSIPCPSTINAYYRLKHTNPSPYMFYMRDEDFIIFGASPESSVKYTEANREIEMSPIAGTRGRGFTADGTRIDLDLDSRIELDLRQDKKKMQNI